MITYIAHVLLFVLSHHIDPDLTIDQIPPRELRIQESKAIVEIYKSRLGFCEINLEYSKVEYEFYQRHVLSLRKLLEKSAIPVSEYEEAEMRMKLKEIEIKQDRIEIEEAKAELKLAEIRLKLSEAGIPVDHDVPGFRRR